MCLAPQYFVHTILSGNLTSLYCHNPLVCAEFSWIPAFQESKQCCLSPSLSPLCALLNNYAMYCSFCIFFKFSKAGSLTEVCFIQGFSPTGQHCVTGTSEQHNNQPHWSTKQKGLCGNKLPQKRHYHGDYSWSCKKDPLYFTSLCSESSRKYLTSIHHEPMSYPKFRVWELEKC